MDKSTHLARTTDLGRISVSAEAIAQVVGNVAAESYGIVGMAGRRLQAGGYAEISAVCVHPEHRRQGLAAALTAAVAHGLRADGLTPSLHVASSNANALRVYEALGFTARTEVSFALLRCEPEQGRGG